MTNRDLIKKGLSLKWETIDTNEVYRECDCEEPNRGLTLLAPPVEECPCVRDLSWDFEEPKIKALQVMKVSDGEVYHTPSWVDEEFVFTPDKITRKPALVPQRKPLAVPDISRGIGKNQENTDLRELENFAIADNDICIFDGVAFVYNGIFWEEQGKYGVIRHLRKKFQKVNIDCRLSMKEYSDIRQMLLANPDIQREQFFTPEHSLNLLDGRLDIVSMRLYPHDPEDGYFGCIRLESDEILNPVYGDMFERFMDDNPGVRQQILEMIAIAVTGYQAKAFYVLAGPSGAGKSQAIRFLLELLQHKNVMSFSSPAEVGKQFALEEAKQKMAAVCMDALDAVIPPAAIGRIKQLCGDDAMEIQRKHKPPIMLYEKPLVVIATNHSLKVANAAKEEAFFKRQIIIPFGEGVPSERQIPKFYKLLLEESGYILHEAILVYQGLMKNGFQLTRAEYIPAEYNSNEANEAIVGVQHFLDACCDVSEDSRISTDDLHKAYELFAYDEGFESLNKIVFGRALADVLSEFDNITQVKRIDGKDTRGYKGIKLKEGGENDGCWIY